MTKPFLCEVARNRAVCSPRSSTSCRNRLIHFVRLMLLARGGGSVTKPRCLPGGRDHLPVPPLMIHLNPLATVTKKLCVRLPGTITTGTHLQLPCRHAWRLRQAAKVFLRRASVRRFYRGGGTNACKRLVLCLGAVVWAAVGSEDVGWRGFDLVG